MSYLSSHFLIRFYFFIYSHLIVSNVIFHLEETVRTSTGTKYREKLRSKQCPASCEGVDPTLGGFTPLSVCLERNFDCAEGGSTG